MYVYDILVIGSSEGAIQALITKLNDRFVLKDLGKVDYFLGIEVRKTEAGIHLSQTKYITDLLCKAKMQYARSVAAPMTTG